jgi:hypothetical protein
MAAATSIATVPSLLRPSDELATRTSVLGRFAARLAEGLEAFAASGVAEGSAVRGFEVAVR